MTDERAFEPTSAGRGQRSWLRLPIVAALLLALLGIVAFASRSHRSPAGGRGAGPPAHVWDYFLSAYLVLGGLMFLLLIWALFTQPRRLKPRRQRSDVRQIAIFMTVLLSLALIAGTNPDLLERLRLGDGGNEGAPAAGAQQNPRSPRLEDAPDPRWRWAPGLVIGALAIGGAVAYVALGRGARQVRSQAEVAESIALALDDVVEQLRAEHDPRAAIIAAYARLEGLLAAHGVPRRPSEAPFEYLARVLIELETTPGAVFELTHLFERAKFSHHRIDGSMKEDAIAALVAVRDELRGRA